MRCPECQKRNSVAAWKCKFCGAKFKRKTMSMGKRAVLFAAGAVIGGAIYLAFALPKMVDPAEQLMSTAKRVASGPSSPEDAKKSKAEFDEAVKKLLVRYGDSSLTALSARLKSCLPPNGPFEVVVVELPKALKLVEVDTVLQASDFLVMKGTNDTRVIPLQGFEVYDDARTANDGSGTVMVLLGHSSGQLPHRPIVKTYALLPDDVADDTASMVPSILGDGTAKFGKDNTDIFVELALPSIALAEKITINTPLPQDRLAKIKLQWKDAKYVPTMDFPPDLPSAMVLLARSLKYPEYAGSVTAALGTEAGKLMKEQASREYQDMVITKNPDKKKTSSYTIASGTKHIDLEMKKAGASWQVDSYKVTVQAAPIAVATSTSTGTSESTTAGTNTPAGTATDTAAHGTPTNSTSSSASVSTVNSGSVDTKNGTVATSGTETNGNNSEGKSNSDPRQKSGQEILAGLSPAKAGTNNNDPGKGVKNSGSSWLDDPNEKTPVAVLPPNSKNDKKAAEEKAAREKAEREKQEKEKADKKQKEKADREKAEKEKAEREKAEKEKADREKAEKEKAAREKAEREKSEQVESSAVSSGKISDTLGTQSVRLRSGPGLNSKTVDEIPKGSKIQILGKKSGWYKVSYGGKVGFVFAPLVDTSGKSSASSASSSTPDTPTPPRTAPPPTPAASNDSGSGGSVIVRPMNVRDENRRVLTTVQPGQRVQVISGLVNNRYKIRLQDGTVGYVNKEAIRHVKVESPPEFVP